VASTISTKQARNEESTTPAVAAVTATSQVGPAPGLVRGAVQRLGPAAESSPSA
jgi:hypothetical protein